MGMRREANRRPCLRRGGRSGMKEIQIFRNEIQAGRNKFQSRRNEIQIVIPCFPSPNLAFSRTYADPWSILQLPGSSSRGGRRPTRRFRGTPEPYDLLDRHAAIARRETGVSRTLSRLAMTEPPSRASVWSPPLVHGGPSVFVFGSSGCSNKGRAGAFS
jgi:hypothetical protein